MSGHDRTVTLFERLGALDAAQFEAVITRLGLNRAFLPGASASGVERASAVVRMMGQRGDEGLDRLSAQIDAVLPPMHEDVPARASKDAPPTAVSAQVSVTQGSSVAPAKTDASITILHVSDMQFGRNHRFGRLALGGADEAFDTLLQRLCDDLDDLRKSHGLEPDVVALTGDLAEWGMKREFDDVLAFCEGLRTHLGLARDRVLVVPGNHDINRKKCSAYFDDREGDGAKPVAPYWPKWGPYADFFASLYQGVDRYAFTERAPWTLFEIPEMKLVVAGMNSTMRESHRDEDHYGWLGEAQLRWFRERLEAYEAKGWMRVGMVHHNALRRATDDDENLRDADMLQEILADHLNVLLHGHTHDGRAGALGLGLPVISTGSAAVKQEQRPEEVPNQYQLVRLSRDRLWCGARQYTAQRRRWVGDPRVSKGGNDWWYERRVPFEHVDATFE